MKAPNREPEEWEKSRPLRIAGQAEYRAAIERQRAMQFETLQDRVLGIPVEPLTLRTFSILVATGSRFIRGGVPQEDDVIDYLWIHSPLFVLPDHPQHRVRKHRALAALRRHLGQPWMRWIGRKPRPDRYLAALAIACANILDIVGRAFAHIGGSSARLDAPLVSLEAAFVHKFAANLGWPEAKTRATPLGRLFLLDRCIRRAGGDDIVDPGEENLHAAHLLTRNAELAAARAAHPKTPIPA